MALTTKDIYNLTKEINEYGATLYYLIETKKIDVSDIENVLFKDSIDQVNLVFPNLISRINVEDINNSYDKYSKEFTKLSCIDKIILEDENKYQHLKEMRDVVNLDKKIDLMIKDKPFKMAYNLNYTEKIFDLIEKKSSKKYISIKDKVKLYKDAILELQSEIYQKLNSNIDNYYISTITS